MVESNRCTSNRLLLSKSADPTRLRNDDELVGKFSLLVDASVLFIGFEKGRKINDEAGMYVKRLAKDGALSHWNL